jgi:hypothetical protein
MLISIFSFQYKISKCTLGKDLSQRFVKNNTFQVISEASFVHKLTGSRHYYIPYRKLSFQYFVQSRWQASVANFMYEWIDW